MLTELKALHEELLSKMDDLIACVSQAEPDRGRLANARLELSRASARRLRHIEGVIYPHLLERVGDADIQRLQQLRLENATLRAASTRHVGTWTIEKVLADWEGYRRASSAMMRSMQHRIAAEENLLYALLERYPPRPVPKSLAARGA